MPEIKNTFVQGKMNKDLDERIIPNGQYRDAMNVQITTSEGSDVGTVQNIMGNTRVENIIESDCKCVGSITNQKTNKIYWFIKKRAIYPFPAKDMILEYSIDDNKTTFLVLVDIKAGTSDAVLNFPNDIITGINIVDNLLFWTDNYGEPKKVNIDQCKNGSIDKNTHTKLVIDGEYVVARTAEAVADDAGIGSDTLTISSGNPEVGDILFSIDGTVLNTYTTIISITLDTLTLSNLQTWGDNSVIVFHKHTDIEEDHITVIKKKPTKAPTIKVNKVEEDNITPLFEKVFPRFACRYKYADGEYSPFGPFTEPVFKSSYTEDYDNLNYFTEKESYNVGMSNTIESIELTDFIATDIPSDVVQVDILYKQEDSPIIYSIDNIKRTDDAWTADGSNQGTEYDSTYKGFYKVTTENIHAAVPSNQLLRPWDNIPRKALAQEITGNRMIYGNYLQGYNFGDGTDGKPIKPNITADYKRKIPLPDFTEGALHSIKSLRNYQLGIVYGDKYGRETPVFTSSQGAIKIPWIDQFGNLAASQNYQLTATTDSYHPDWADYYKIFIKETSGEYYNLIMDKVYSPSQHSSEEKEEAIWISFPSSDRNKISEDDYIILKTKVGTVEQHIKEENRFKVLDIKNEAPDGLKYRYTPLGAKTNDGTTTSGGVLNDTTDGPFRDTDFKPTEGKTKLKIFHAAWMSDTVSQGAINGSNLLEAMSDDEADGVYFSFSDVVGNSTLKSSLYKVGDITEDPDGNTWIIQLTDKISTEDGDISTISGTTLSGTLTIKFQKRIKKDTTKFAGRFFVKIASTTLTKSTIEKPKDESTTVNYTTNAAASTYWFADAQSSNNDPANGIINAQFNTAMPSGSTNTIELINGLKLTDTQAGWGTINSTVANRKWFIDNMYMAAAQPLNSNLAKDGGQLWYGGIPTTIEPFVWGGLDGGPITGPQQITHPHVVQLQGGEDQIINGIEGVIATDQGHVGSSGKRRWKVSLYDNVLDSTYGVESDKYFLHLSFTRVGYNLHSNSWGISDNLMRPVHTSTPLSYNWGAALQGIWGGGAFFDPVDSNGVFPNGITGVFAEGSIAPIGLNAVHNIWPSVTGPGIPNTWGYNENYEGVHNSQWDPSSTAGLSQAETESIKKVIDNLKVGKKIKFGTDSTIYTIKKVTEKRIYNHTPWRKIYKWDGSTPNPTIVNGGLITTGNSVEDAAVDWATSSGQSAVGLDEAKAAILKQRTFEFGRNDNRRVCYILELNKNPAAQTFNPVDGSNLDADTSVNINFVDETYPLVASQVVSNPAVWETEPKENVDLDIYYEASQAFPTKINEENRELFAPVGCKVSVIGEPQAKNGSTTITETNYLEAWGDGALLGFMDHFPREFILTPGFNSHDASGNLIDYTDTRFMFFREDGSYTTGVISVETMDPQKYVVSAGGHRTNFVVKESVDPGSEVGLGWYNCLSFGNGTESSRIRDDFNTMQITSGVKASSTIEESYQEERRKNGLIYSGIYNSTSGVNNLNQFIMAEKITKDLNPTYGSIQKLFQRRISLVTFCEDRVIEIVSGKDTLYNAEGNPDLISTNRVLGDANPFVGDYGISTNPESFAKESYRAYFTDKARGAVLRLSMDGLTPISDAGMHDYFRDNLKIPNKIIGTYDEFKQDYNITLADYLPENLIVNSTIDEGEALVEYLNLNDYINDGSFALGTQYADIGGIANELINSGLNVKTEITNIDPIPSSPILQGTYNAPAGEPLPWAGVPSTPPTSAINPTFTSVARTIYDWTAMGQTGSNYAGPFGKDGYGTNGSAVGTNIDGEYAKVRWNQTGNDCSQQSSTAWGSLATGPNAGSAGCPPWGVNPNWYTGSTNNPAGVAWGYDFVYSSGDYPGSSSSYYSGNWTNYGDIAWQGTSGNLIMEGRDPEIWAKLGGLGNSGVRPDILAAFPNDTDNVIRNGEEISVEVTVAIPGGNDTPSPKFRLYDGNTALAASKVHAPTGTGAFGSVHVTTPSTNPDGTTPGYLSTPYHLAGGSGGSRTIKMFWKFTNLSSSGSNSDNIVVNNLQIRVQKEDTDDWVTWSISKYKIRKVYRMDTPWIDSTSGSAGIDPDPLTTIPIGGTTPASVNITHSIDNWEYSNVDLFSEAEAIYGNAVYWDEVSTQGLNQFPNGMQPGSTNSTAVYNGNIQPSAGNVRQDLSLSSGIGKPLVLGNWYRLTVEYPTSNPPTGLLPLAYKVIDPALPQGSTSSTQPTIGVGEVSGGGSGSLIMEDNSNGTLMAEWQHTTAAVGGDDLIKIYFWTSNLGQYDNIELRDLTTAPIGGEAVEWNLGGNNPCFATNTCAATAYKNVYWDSGKIVFYNGGESLNNHIAQTFINTPLPSPDGYEFKFKILDYTSGELEGSIYGEDDNGFVSGFSFSGVNANGDWVIKANMDGTTTSMTNDTGSGAVAAGTLIGVTSDNGISSGQWNKIRIAATTASATSTAPFNGAIDEISLKDTTNYFTGGSTGNWVFGGFNPAIEEYIIWNSYGKYIEFNAAPVGTQLQQNIIRNFVEGETYNLKFDVTNYSGNGVIKGYFYDDNGKGFSFGPINGNINYDSSTFIELGETTAQDHVIGDDTQSGIELFNTLVIYVESGEFTAELDNFELSQVFPGYVPSTLTFSEDVRGWVSFKSFIPENGASVNNNYYTFFNGRLYQHHANSVRNQFYDHNVIESSITAVLNTEPSLVKMFNTLNYEGSQSKINAFTSKTIGDLTITNADSYNLTPKHGWYVDSIITDKQNGSLNEFIEKEGKWFNYIRGEYGAIDTSSFTFQGLGVIRQNGIVL